MQQGSTCRGAGGEWGMQQGSTCRGPWLGQWPWLPLQPPYQRQCCSKSCRTCAGGAAQPTCPGPLAQPLCVLPALPTLVLLCKSWRAANPLGPCCMVASSLKCTPHSMHASTYACTLGHATGHNWLSKGTACGPVQQQGVLPPSAAPLTSSSIHALSDFKLS